MSCLKKLNFLRNACLYHSKTFIIRNTFQLFSFEDSVTRSNNFFEKKKQHEVTTGAKYKALDTQK